MRLGEKMKKTARVFLVDDGEDDTYLLKEAFLQLDDCPAIDIFSNGSQLLETLRALHSRSFPT